MSGRFFRDLQNPDGPQQTVSWRPRFPGARSQRREAFAGRGGSRNARGIVASTWKSGSRARGARQARGPDVIWRNSPYTALPDPVRARCGRSKLIWRRRRPNQVGSLAEDPSLRSEGCVAACWPGLPRDHNGRGGRARSILRRFYRDPRIEPNRLTTKDNFRHCPAACKLIWL